MADDLEQTEEGAPAPTRPAGEGREGVERLEQMLRSVVDHAYEYGYHEHGHDIVSAFRDALRASALRPATPAAPNDEVKRLRAAMDKTGRRLCNFQ